MIKPQSTPDGSTSGFSADDEFASAADPWRPTSNAGEALEDDDPFLTPQEPIEAFEPSDSEDPIQAAPINPVGDLIAGAEAVLGEASVPRITIHIFCERTDTAEVAEKCATDRRMSRATTEVRAGGLAAAVAQYQNQPTPSLVIVESLDDGAAACWRNSTAWPRSATPAPRSIVIGAHNDIALYRELMRRGVSEYLVPPLQPLQLIGAITTLYADPAAPFVGRQIAFVGAKGGVGSSTVAHNLAYLLSETHADQYGDRRPRPAVRHRRPRLQPGPPARRGRRAQPARPARPGAARPDDGALQRPAQPVRRAGDAGRGLRHLRRGLRGGDQQDPRHGALSWCSTCRTCGRAGCAAPCSAPTMW